VSTSIGGTERSIPTALIVGRDDGPPLPAALVRHELDAMLVYCAPARNNPLK
jgi:hypothetical protein